MSDKNPYYSIPKALGEPRIEIDMLPSAVDMSDLVELREYIERPNLGGILPASSRAIDRADA